MVAGPEDAIAVEEEDLPESERRWKHESVTVERCKGFCNAPEMEKALVFGQHTSYLSKNSLIPSLSPVRYRGVFSMVILTAATSKGKRLLSRCEMMKCLKTGMPAIMPFKLPHRPELPELARQSVV